MRLEDEALLTRLQNNDPQLKSLDFSRLGTTLDDSMVASFASAATSNSTVEELSIPMENLSVTGCERLATVLSSSDTIKSVSITCATSSRASCWIQFFSALHATKIQKLYIDTATLDRPFQCHEREVIATFFRTNRSITSLDLVCYDDDGDDSAGAGNECAQQSYCDGCSLTDCILDGLAGNSTVRSLCIADYMYSRSGRQSLQSFLGLNEGVSTLECISDIPDMATALIDGLQCNCKPREVRITNFSEEASHAFFSAFSTTNNVTTLEVTNCHVTGQALLPFIQGVRKNTTLRSLVVGLGEDIPLSQFLKQCIAPVIMNHPSLKEVHIQDVENNFDHVGATALGDALIQNAHLDKCTIQSKEITTNAAMFLSLRIPSIQFLKSITLVGTVSEQGKQMMADKLRDNYSLTEVAFDPCDTTSRAEVMITQLCKRNHQIERSKVVLPLRMTPSFYPCKTAAAAPAPSRETPLSAIGMR